MSDTEFGWRRDRFYECGEGDLDLDLDRTLNLELGGEGDLDLEFDCLGRSKGTAGDSKSLALFPSECSDPFRFDFCGLFDPDRLVSCRLIAINVAFILHT